MLEFVSVLEFLVIREVISALEVPSVQEFGFGAMNTYDQLAI